jgi:hypothetical protein
VTGSLPEGGEDDQLVERGSEGVKIERRGGHDSKVSYM